MKSVTTANELIEQLNFFVTSRAIEDEHSRESTILLYETELFCSKTLDNDFLKSHQKTIHSIIICCIGRIFSLKEQSQFYPYLLVLRLLTKQLRSAFKSECIVKQLLPLICAMLWIQDEKLMETSVNLIRLSIRYHPSLASEIVVESLLTELHQTKLEQTIQILFLIQAYNPTCFHYHRHGKSVLSLFLQPNVPPNIQKQGLELMNRILDDLPCDKDATKSCIGPLNECFEIMLTSISEETSELSSSLMIKLAKRNLSEAMLPHANRHLPDQMKINWPGCLETALSLLVALSHDCFRHRHEHSRISQTETSDTPCIEKSIEAIFRYIEETDDIKYLISCLVALQDLSPIINLSILEPGKYIIAKACDRFEIGTRVLWNDLWMEVDGSASPHSQAAVKMNFRNWLYNVPKDTGLNHTPRESSKSRSMSSASDLEYAYSRQSSRSGGSFSRKLSPSPRMNRSYAEDRKTRFKTNTPEDMAGDHELTNEHPAMQNNYTNESDGSELSSSSQSSTFSAISYGQTEIAFRSLPRKYETCDTSNRLPVISLKRATNHKAIKHEQTNTNHSEVRRVQSVKYPHQPDGSSNEKMIGLRRTQSSHRPATQVDFNPTKHRVNGNPNTMPTLSSPQLSPFDNQDPIQRFHQRYYDKLLQYLEYVQNLFPLPVAVGYQNPVESHKRSRNNTKDFVWCIPKYDYLSENQCFQYSFNYGAHSSASVGSDRRQLYLYFECTSGQAQCMYPGRTLTNCFRLKTKFALLWLQLLILWNQARYGKAIPTNHPAMYPVRYLWAQIVNAPFDFSLERQAQSGADSNAGQKLDRPRSACESDSHHPTGLVNSMPLRSRQGSKKWFWNSTRTRSKSGVAKVNSFFLFATRAYPNQKECEQLVKELQAASFFQSFVRRDEHCRKQEQKPVDQSPNESNRSQSHYGTSTKLATGQSHGWSCLLCQYTQATTRNRPPSSKRVAPLARRESESESVLDNSSELVIPGSPHDWNPYMTGVLRSRHLKNMPKALSWLSTWQLNEFVLRDGFFGWHRWSSTAKLPTHQKSPKRERNRSVASKTSPGQITETSSSDRELSHTHSDSKQVVNCELNTKDVNWTAFHVLSIRAIKCTRKARTGALIQITIDTEKHGTLLLRSSRPGQYEDHNRSSTMRPLSISCIHSNELTVWMHGLHAAMARASRGP